MDVDAALEQAQIAADLALAPGPEGDGAQLVGTTNMDAQHQRGFAVLQGIVQRGGLEAFEQVLRLRDDTGDGFLTLHDMRAVLDVPTHFAAGDVDYRRYRITAAPRVPYQVTKTELDDLVSLAARDATGRRIHYTELIDLGASLMDVEGLKQLLSEGFVEILPQHPAEAIDKDGGYTRSVLGRNRLRAASGETMRDKDVSPQIANSRVPLKDSPPVPLRMPIWWLCWQQSFWFTQFLTFNLLLNILLPFRVVDLLGKAATSNKAFYLALMNTVANFVSLTSVFWGAASDATRTRWGRRRPYIIVGQALACVGLFLMNIAPSIWLLTGAFAVYVLANNIGCAVYSTVVAELVPADQRGTAGGFFMVFQTTGNLASSVVGYLVGDTFMTSSQAYALLIGLNALDFLVGVSGLSQRPGLLRPEAPPPQHSDVSKSSGAAAAATNATACQKICSFLSAFRNRSFTSMFFFMATIASFMTITNQFLGYWVQDVLGAPISASMSAHTIHSHTQTDEASSYSFFGWHLTNSAQSATAILIAITSCANAPSNLIGGVLSDRIGKRSILVVAAVVQIWCPFVQAYTKSFSVAISIACFCGLTGGLFGGPINALQAEVLPADENGVPLYASRDVNLIGLAWVLPGLLLPMGLAHMFKVFSDPYRIFFQLAGVLIIIQSPMLLGVHPKLTSRERNSPRRRLVSKISKLEQDRRAGKLTQSQFRWALIFAGRTKNIHSCQRGGLRASMRVFARPEKEWTEIPGFVDESDVTIIVITDQK